MNDNKRKELKEKFREQLAKNTELFSKAISTGDGDWVVKGFIDISKNIYTISFDTKVISKIMELVLLPRICQFARDNNYKIVLCREQNFYPDVSFVDAAGNKFALDLKSTYRKNSKEVNGMTLGAFTGYFRDRKSKKNCTFSYEEYIGHFVLGIIYSRSGEGSESTIYRLDELQSISSVVKDFTFFIHEKYRIASSRPGSGNTKNIGSVTKIDELVNGKGPFALLGEDAFDDYWMYYLTKDMARAVELKIAPYRNLDEYRSYKKVKSGRGKHVRHIKSTT